MKRFDAIIIGAGAAGLFCASVAAQRGLRILLIDHAPKLAEKIRISGGGRCNFTNRDLDVGAPHKHFLGDNPQFCRSALSRYTPQDFVSLMQKHGIAFVEKHKGQLFCERSATDLIDMLNAETRMNGGNYTRANSEDVLIAVRGQGIERASSDCSPRSAVCPVIAGIALTARRYSSSIIWNVDASSAMVAYWRAVTAPTTPAGICRPSRSTAISPD